MADLTLAQIEDALLATLQVSATLGSYCKTIESYAGQLEEDLDTMVIRTPACFVMLSSSSAQARTNRQQEKFVTFSLLLLDRNARGNRAARRGDLASIGVYTMLHDAQVLLVGNTLGLTEFHPLLLQQETAVLNTKSLALYDAQYRSQYLITTGG
jgi:phage gp37-like protein